MKTTLSKAFGSGDVIGEVLRGFRVFSSLTPQSFSAKVQHFNSNERRNTAGVFVDVLRATTTLTVIGARRVEGIHLAVKPRSGGYDLTPPVFPDANWIFDGEENGRPIEGGIIGNSPAAAAEGQFGGSYMKFFSTNGARALEALVNANLGGVYLMSMANIDVTMRQITDRGFKNIWLVAGGFYGSLTLEDTVCCGRAISWLIERGIHGAPKLDDESRIAVQAAGSYVGDDDRLVEDLRESQVAKLLNAIGRGADVPMSVDGRGLSSPLWERMRATIMRLTLVDTTHLLVPEHLPMAVQS